MPYITYSRNRDNSKMLKACEVISELFINPLVARRGRKSVRSAIKDALLKGHQKIILVAGAGKELRTSVIKINGQGQDYTWQSAYHINFKSNKLHISEGDSGDATERFIKEAED
jgi:hypothetical protein